MTTDGRAGGHILYCDMPPEDDGIVMINPELQ